MRREIGLKLGRVFAGVALALSVLATPALAQVTVGDNLNMSMNGNLGVGYSGEYGNSGLSSHGLFGMGMGQLSGSYYNPNFLSFNVRPFYNRNQDNGSFASVLSETGVDVSTNLFSGSHFPGSLSYSKSFIDGSQYGGLPGLAGLSSNGDNQVFTISWSELIPDWPSLTATFSDNTNSSTILGESGTTDSKSRTFTLLSHYQIDGFHLMGLLNHQNFDVTLPAFLAPTNSHSNSSGTSYDVSADHALPLSGTFVASYNRTDYNSQTGSFQNHGSTDTADAVASLKPLERLTVNGQVRYTRNLFGLFEQSFLPGGPATLLANDETSHGLSLSTYGNYNIGHGFILVGYANRQMETFAGTSYNFNQAGGTLTYSYARPLFGVLYFSFGMVNNATNNGGGNLGFVGNVGLKKQFGQWQLDSDFSYSQNVQTLIANYTTSNYTYGGTLRRRFGANMFWSGSYRGVQSGLAQYRGYGNRSDSVITTFTRGKYGISGSFSKSHGTSLLSSTGALTPTPIAPLISAEQIVYGGKVYGVGVHATPTRKMLINVNWYRVRSDTLTANLLSNNNSERYYAQMQYSLRQLYFRAGYWRVQQSVGFNLPHPVLDNTYFFNISRWFNLF